MYGYFTFEFSPRNPPGRNLVIFCATSSPAANAVSVVVRKFCESAISPDCILLLGMASEASLLDEISKDRNLLDLLPTHTRSSSTPAIRVGLIPREGRIPTDDICGVSWHELCLAGMSHIFRTRNALLVAPPTHHFAKPSTRHCDRFIRTANAMVDGAEITFIAAACLGFVRDNVRHFYCDTGGISVLAFAIDSLRRRFDQKAVAATVNTFESYTGLKHFEFRECESSVVLVSASTSAGLEEEICQREKRFSPDQIITVFSVGRRHHGSHVVLNIEEDHALRQSLGEWVSYSHSACPLCDKRSIAVPMLGDQFIPVRSETRTVLVARNDAPAWLPRFLELTARRQCLRAFYRSSNTFHATNDVFVDLERVLAVNGSESLLLQRVDRLSIQHVPAATRRIVHLDDPASLLFARRIATRLGQAQNGSSCEVIAASEADRCAALRDGVCVVVAAAVASGQSLLAVSQSLRNLQTNGAITYLVALSRMATSGELEKLERDLRMGELASDYGFAVCERIYLPLVGRNTGCAWDRELELLQEWANVADQATRATFENRINRLRGAQSAAERGLASDLFWPSVGGRPLVVRHGFVFLPRSINPLEVSQGDVYFAIASVLHHLRSNAGSKGQLRQTEYERRVLSPLCFDRFNDGIIQASFLRAALRPELDYSASVEESGRMTAVLRSILRATNTDKGEASREFILAMALNRLSLIKSDTEALFDEFSDLSDPVSKRMWQHIYAEQLQ